MRHLCLAALALCLLSACGGVKYLSIHDERLNLEAQRTLAGADDAVAVARAQRDYTAEQLLVQKQWRTRFSTTVIWPPSAAAGEAATKRAELADARVDLARLDLALAEADLALERAKLDQVTARIAIRFEIAYYDLDALKEVVNAARETVGALHKATVNKREELDKMTTAWWLAYDRYLKANGDKHVLWKPVVAP